MSARREARELAFRAIYQADVTGEPPDRCLREIVASSRARPEAVEFATTLIGSLESNRAEVDETVRRTSTNWSLARMAATDRSIIRLATAELLFQPTPTRVALDEAIEIAKKYGLASSGAFVNGILDRIAHEARPSLG